MIQCQLHLESWALKEPFGIAREVITEQPVITISLSDGQGHIGRAEAAGVDYDGETPAGIAAQITALLPRLHDRLTGQDLLRLLPAGGARNALDCALWDLRAKQTGVPVWQRAGLQTPVALTTAYTIGLGDEATTRRKLREARGFPLLKLKVDAERHLAVVQMARQEHPQARLLLDANGSWSLALLQRLMPELQAARVELIEQPLPRGSEALLRGLPMAVPLAADESCTDTASLAALVGAYAFVNIKLDKCGGLTEALAMVAEATKLGLGLMVGNMCGTSLAMAPAFLVAQRCVYADLDGPLLQMLDRAVPMVCRSGVLQPPLAGLWG